MGEDERSESSGKPGEPVRLEYFAAPATNGDARGWSRLWLLLGLGWGPFACGVVSSQAVVRSGWAELIHTHVRAGVLFMLIGLLISAGCGAAFARAKQMTGLVAAAVSLVVQTGLF